jgi:hypothetical protein
MKEAACRTDLGPLTKKLLEQQQVIERLTAERDEARRMYCGRVSRDVPLDAFDIAKDHGWDCFREKAP